MSLEQFNKEHPEYFGKKKSKYGNKHVTVDNYTFDSQAEAKYYGQLRLRKLAKDIKDFRVHPRYVLQQDPDITYEADFEITHNDLSTEVIDVKGVRTQVYINKIKMFKKHYPHLKFTEVRLNEI